ncbi:MAG: HAD family hydrolase [Acidobacteria bacterium]|nr:MAG: HAD family hydrolase [Acidobacteriota bacterium]
MTIPKTALDQMELLVFDLDGTLVDSELDLANSVNATLETIGRMPLSVDLIASYVGQGVSVLISRALGAESTSELVERATEIFLSHYREHMLDHTATYPGVREALSELDGRKLAVLTNKPVRFSREMLKGLGLAHCFLQIYGGNSFENKKPDPIGLHRLMEETGAPASRTMMIGDSVSDVLAGRNAGAWTCGVNYGFGAPTLDEVPPDIRIDNLRELPKLLNGKS